MIDTQATKKKRSFILPIAAGIVTLAIAGFLASRAGLDKALVKQQVDNFAARLHEQGAAHGRDVTLTYGDLAVAGGLMDKHVIIKDPVLTVKPLQPTQVAPGEKKPIDALRVTTPEVEIYPNPSSMTVKLAKPIDFAGEDTPDKSLLKVTVSEPLQVALTKHSEDRVDYSDITLYMPPQLDMVYLRETQAEGKEEQTPTLVPVYENLKVTMAPGGSSKSSLAEDASGLGKVTMDYHTIVITPEKSPEQALKIAEITGEWSNTLNDKNLNVVKAALKFGPATSADATAPYQPVQLDLDASFEGSLPKTPEAIAKTTAQDSVMMLKTFNLSTKDASLKATANFTAKASDALPVGTANITLSNAPYVLAQLKEHAILNPDSEQLVAVLLERITGKPLDQLKYIEIPVERVRDGAFKIGNATFEDLFAILLQNAMKHNTAKIVPPAPAAAPEKQVPAGTGATGQQGALEPRHVPQLPSANKPKTTPIEIPDLSVRG